MKAVIYKTYGSPEVLSIVDQEKPVPNENEVLVKIKASTVTTVDSIFRRGEHFFARLFTGLFKPKFPTLGTELSGEIDAVGKNVTRFKPGDHVFGSARDDMSAHAEYICLPENWVLVIKPENLTFEEAAAVPSGALTALPFLRDNGAIKSGQKVLIIGASGSIGSFAVQLAKYYKTEVTGVCSSKNLDLVKSLGADFVIDYTSEDFAKHINNYDIIFDTVGKSSFGVSKRALSEKGIYLNPVISFTILFQMLWTIKRRKKAIFAATGMRSAADGLKDLLFLKELIETGLLKPVIDRTYPLKEISEAYRYVDKGHKKGNVVIKIGD